MPHTLEHADRSKHVLRNELLIRNSLLTCAISDSIASSLHVRHLCPCTLGQITTCLTTPRRDEKGMANYIRRLCLSMTPPEWCRHNELIRRHGYRALLWPYCRFSLQFASSFTTARSTFTLILVPVLVFIIDEWFPSWTICANSTRHGAHGGDACSHSWRD